MNYYVDEHIKNTKRVFPGQGRYDYLRYDMNENPEGLPKEFVDSVLQEITPEFLSVYPEPDKFLNKYASFIHAQYENVLATNGSDMAIRYLLETFGEEGKEVVTVAPSFEMYWVNCSILGLKHVPVAYESDMSIKTENIVNAISEDTRIVVLVNPNNPVGNVYSEDDFKSIVSRARDAGAIVIVDEAYHYFYPNTFMEYALKGENVVILRTFSKLLSLAACRIGVIISNPRIIQYVKNAKLTFDVNSVALLFAEKILDHPELIAELIETEKAGKSYALKELQKKGYEYRDCEGNYFLVKPRHPAQEVAEALRSRKKILVHTFSNELLKDYLRISTGSRKAMEVFVEAFFETDESHNGQ
ncbi:MAG: histidinol-phosphate aminotransferase family protein [Lachnospiraceae bacterium]|nr:histidinol-phosphate aminotransferase family protein [Lachnospiraceae bacterium]MDE6982560.1 histidinol-phosphate aminotransferase family protein [Lachnospiraceae bacterium]